MGRKKGLGTHSKQRESVQRPCGEKHGEEESGGGQCDWSPGTTDKLETFVGACWLIRDADAARSRGLGCS